MKTVEVKTRVEENLRDDFKAYCERRGVSVSEYLRRMIKNELQQESKTCREKVS